MASDELVQSEACERPTDVAQENRARWCRRSSAVAQHLAEHPGNGLLTPFDTSPESMATWNEDIERRKKSGVSAPGEGPPPFVIGLNRPDRYSVIADAMAARGYRSRTIEKVLGENFARVFADTWKTGPQNA